MTGFWAGKRTLVLGACGWLGSCLTRALADLGAEVTGADCLETSAPWRAQGLAGRVPLRKRNVADFDNALYTVRGHNEGPRGTHRPYDVVMHLAGRAHIGSCQRDPVATFNANVVATFNVLEACRIVRDEGAPLQAVVVSSSDRVYTGGRKGRSAPYTEADRLDAADSYSSTKACADQLVRMYAVSYGLPVAAIRHSNIYGPLDPEPSRIVPGTILSLLAGKAPVIRSDGSPRKSYLYLDDVLAAYLRLAVLLADGVRPEVVNAAPDSSITVRALVNALIQISGLNLAPDVTGEDTSQSGYWEELDAGRYRHLGWSPKVPLLEGLVRTWDWYKARGGMAWLATS